MLVARFPTTASLRFDANGIPLGDKDGMDAAAKAVQQHVRELPEDFYHLDYWGAYDVAERAVRTYLRTVQQVQGIGLEVRDEG